MEIKKITKLKSGKYKLEFENKTTITTYDEIILENNLLFKKEIDNELYDKIANATLDYDLYSRVLKYILIKMRNLKEIKKYMDKLDIKESNQNKIITKLKENNFINDERYTEAYIADKINLSNIGPNKIKKELEEHDIDINIINKYLDKYEDEIFIEKIEKIITKKIKTQKCSNYIFKQKIIKYLLDLGYDLDMINDSLNKFEFNSNIQKDYERIKRKLETKYNDNELNYQIKNKLYQKGYSKEEIESIN